VALTHEEIEPLPSQGNVALGQAHEQLLRARPGRTNGQAQPSLVRPL
jgi:hypothetical protein